MPVERGEQYVIALGVIGRPGSFTLTSSPLPGVSQVVESDVLIGIENVTGSNHAETITGNELANTLDGRGGSDTIDGGFGDDILIGNGGTDTASFLSHDGLLPTAVRMSSRSATAPPTEAIPASRPWVRSGKPSRPTCCAASRT